MSDIAIRPLIDEDAAAFKALRLKANRLKVVRAGKVIAETPERVAALHLDGRPNTVNGADYAPKI